MTGYSDIDGYNISDEHHLGRSKLGPSIPRIQPHHHHPCMGNPTFHTTDFLLLNHPPPPLGFDRSKRHNSSATTTVVSSSRWNPTPDQLETLEELFRQGTQSPTAEEIQHIAAKLRRYGKIEGKNVFYWFQNHKARERHKRRRKSDTTSHVGTDILENEQKSADFEVEEVKRWSLPTNYSTLAQEAVLMQRPKETAATDVSVVLEERDFQQKPKQVTWQNMKLSYSLSSTLTLRPTTTTDFINTTTMSALDMETLEPKLINTTSREPIQPQTLELFPLRSYGGRIDNIGGEDEQPVGTSKFFEFL